MKGNKIVLAALLVAGTLGLTALPASADSILLKVQLPGTNYCHLRFPAIRENTLTWARPVLKDPSSGDIVDFYGPCNYDPVGKEAVQAQVRELERRLREDGN